MDKDLKRLSLVCFLLLRWYFPLGLRTIIIMLCYNLCYASNWHIFLYWLSIIGIVFSVVGCLRISAPFQIGTLIGNRNLQNPKIFSGPNFQRYRLQGFRDEKVAHLPILILTFRDKPILICSLAAGNPTGNTGVQFFIPNNLGGYIGSKDASAARLC